MMVSTPEIGEHRREAEMLLEVPGAIPAKEAKKRWVWVWSPAGRSGAGGSRSKGMRSVLPGGVPGREAPGLPC